MTSPLIFFQISPKQKEKNPHNNNTYLYNSKFKNEASNYIKNLDIIHLYGSLRGASYDLDNLLQEYGAYDKFNFDDKDSCIVNRARELYRRDYQTGRMASLIWID